jgi:NTP pyrophosphatase (non-canonical NTP hydrolase)
MKNLQLLMDDLSQWSDKTFGDSQRTLPITHHLKKEVDELIDALKGCQDIQSVIVRQDFLIMEFADCLTLLLDAAHHEGITGNKLIEAAYKKLEINKKRKWGKPDKNGVIEHIR